MAALGGIIAVVGLIIAFIGGIKILILAFQESILWGLGSLLLGFVSLIFVAMHWEKSKDAFLMNLGGCAIMFLGGMMSAMGAG